MKSQWFLLGFALLFITGCATIQPKPASQDQSPSQPPNEQTRSITTNEWVVRLAPGVDPSQLAMQFGADWNFAGYVLIQASFKFLYNHDLNPCLTNVCTLFSNPNIRCSEREKFNNSVITGLFIVIDGLAIRR